jgi:hypothetical protein
VFLACWTGDASERKSGAAGRIAQRDVWGVRLFDLTRLGLVGDKLKANTEGRAGWPNNGRRYVL